MQASSKQVHVARTACSKQRISSLQVRFLPFQLAPDCPKEGVNKLQYYYDKFGPRTDAIVANMKQ